MQIRMSSELKAQVEELYHELGTSFAEAVRFSTKSQGAAIVFCNIIKIIRERTGRF